IYHNLTFRVLVAIAIGAAIGAIWPAWGVALKPLGEAFVNLVKMVVGPIIFLTVSAGIAGIGSLRKAGRVGLKAIVYFELVTTVALAIGLGVGNAARPGAGIDRSRLTVTEQDKKDLEKYRAAGEKQKDFHEFVLHIIPEN